MKVTSLETLEEKMEECWQEIFNKPIAEEIQKIISSGDKKLYGLWLSQVAH